MNNLWLRHYLSVLAYRLRHAIDSAPESYWSFEAGQGVQRPMELLHHIAEMVLWVGVGFLMTPKSS